MQQIPIAEATDQLQELAEAAINGETVVIVIDGTHAVQLTPTRTRRAARKAGSARGQIVYGEDFDAPLSEFDDYLA